MALFDDKGVVPKGQEECEGEGNSGEITTSSMQYQDALVKWVMSVAERKGLPLTHRMYPADFQLVNRQHPNPREDILVRNQGRRNLAWLMSMLIDAQVATKDRRHFLFVSSDLELVYGSKGNVLGGNERRISDHTTYHVLCLTNGCLRISLINGSSFPSCGHHTHDACRQQEACLFSQLIIVRFLRSKNFQVSSSDFTASQWQFLKEHLRLGNVLERGVASNTNFKIFMKDGLDNIFVSQGRRTIPLCNTPFCFNDAGHSGKTDEKSMFCNPCNVKAAPKKRKVTDCS